MQPGRHRAPLEGEVAEYEDECTHQCQVPGQQPRKDHILVDQTLISFPHQRPQIRSHISNHLTKR